MILIATALAAASQQVSTGQCPGIQMNFDVAHSEAQDDSWYRNGHTIVFEKGRKYSQYGLPRVLSPAELEPIGVHIGALVFKEKGVTDHEVIYVLVRLAECEFQPYMLEKGERG